jgi:uncharacterized membrane-anchored protein
MTDLRPFKPQIFKYAAIAVLPLAALLFQPAAYLTVLSLGDRVLLETVPVDPSDFLRGDYVILNYKISEVSDELGKRLLLNDLGTLGGDRPVYVALDLDSRGVAFVSAVSAERPPAEIYLKATLRRLWTDTYSIDYGLGRYYVPEGTGAELEMAIGGESGTVMADVRVLGGRGVIKELLRGQ